MTRLVGPELGFTGRGGRGAQDPVNACLNYGYGVLYSLGSGALELAGLDPFAGFLHVDRPGRESLVLDFVELFRSVIVDRALFSLLGRGWRPVLEEGRLVDDSRRAVAQAVLNRLDYRVAFGGKTYRLQSVMVLQSRLLASFLRGERGELDVFVGAW